MARKAPKSKKQEPASYTEKDLLKLATHLANARAGDVKVELPPWIQEFYSDHKLHELGLNLKLAGAGDISALHLLHTAVETALGPKLPRGPTAQG